MAVRLPTYIDTSLLRYYSLDETARETAIRILWQLCESHPQITFAPTLYPIVAIFLHKHDQDYTYQTMCQLLQRNQQAARDRQFKNILMPTTRLEHIRDIIILIKLCTKFGLFAPFWMRDLVRNEKRFLANHITPFDSPFFDWYRWIFVALPLTYCSRIVDCWLVDGQKFLFRIALAMLYRFRQECSSPVTFSSDKMFEFCSKLELILEPKGGVEQLIKEAKSLRRISSHKIVKVSRKSEVKASTIIESIMRRDSEAINKLYNHGQTAQYIKQSRDDMLSNLIISTRIAPRYFKSYIVDSYELLDDLWQYIPEGAAVKTVSVVFNSNIDGTSLQTFFSRVDPYEETIIIIRTTKNEVFGCYCSSSWSLRKTQAQNAANKSHYFGNGETFLFTLQPKLSVYLWVGKTDSENLIQNISNNHISNHQPQQLNSHTQPNGYISTQLFMSATSQELIVGSGNGSFGLWLDADLTRGKTDHCKTFNNQPLCEDKDFTCKDVEVLAFA